VPDFARELQPRFQRELPLEYVKRSRAQLDQAVFIRLRAVSVSCRHTSFS
jgi:hypothetical protein